MANKSTEDGMLMTIGRCTTDPAGTELQVLHLRTPCHSKLQELSTHWDPSTCQQNVVFRLPENRTCQNVGYEAKKP